MYCCSFGLWNWDLFQLKTEIFYRCMQAQEEVLRVPLRLFIKPTELGGLLAYVLTRTPICDQTITRTQKRKRSVNDIPGSRLQTMRKHSRKASGFAALHVTRSRARKVAVRDTIAPSVLIPSFIINNTNFMKVGQKHHNKH